MKTLVGRIRWAALALVLALFVAAPSAYAQEPISTAVQPETATSALAFGIRAGLAQSEFYGESVANATPGADVTAGAFLSFRLHPQLALQPEVLFTRKRAQVDHSRVFDLAKDARYTLGFIDVPVLLKASMRVQEGPRPYLTAGPYVGFRVYERAKSDYNRDLANLDFDDVFRAWDYGITTGIGVAGITGRQMMTLDVRYAVGLTSLFSDADRPDFRTRGFTFSVGVGL